MEIEDSPLRNVGNKNATRQDQPNKVTNKTDAEAPPHSDPADIHKEKHDASWDQAISRRTKQKMKKAIKLKESALKRATPEDTKKTQATRYNVANKRIISNLPKEDFKIIIRPKKGYP